MKHDRPVRGNGRRSVAYSDRPRRGHRPDRSNLLRDAHAFGCDQLQATSLGQQLMNARAATVLVDAVCAERRRPRGAQDNVPANADPIPMAMAVKHDNTPEMRCQDRYQIRRIDQCQTNTLTQADRNQRIFNNLLMEQGCQLFCRINRSAFNCDGPTTPMALVNAKWLRAFELSRITPYASPGAGGSTNGKIPVGAA